MFTLKENENTNKDDSILLQPFDLGNIKLANRIVMAPMTRSRTTQPGDIPNDLMNEYYTQRSSAGLIISEATQISPQGKGYSYTPGIYTQDQIDGWSKITKSVHNKGGTFFLQLWHVGRMSHESFHPDGLPVAPSAINPQSKVWVASSDNKGEMLDCPTPRELSVSDIKSIINDYRIAAKNAIKAGFDGVEIHAANGYLIDEFLRTSSNKRTDEYGGNIENRIKFLIEVITAIGNEIGFKKIGVRLSPHNSTRGMDCPEIIQTTFEIMKELDKLNILYVHFAEADWDNAPEIPVDFRKSIRSLFNGVIIVAGGYNRLKGETILKNGFADLVAFGRIFISNPDFPARIKNDWPLADFNPETLFGGNSIGYIDYDNFEY